jgi:hypothetical protein
LIIWQISQSFPKTICPKFAETSQVIFLWESFPNIAQILFVKFAQMIFISQMIFAKIWQIIFIDVQLTIF